MASILGGSGKEKLLFLLSIIEGLHMANPKIQLISCGRYHLAALRDDKTVVFWGVKRADFSAAECSDAQNVACGDIFTAIHKSNGSVILKPPFAGAPRDITAMPPRTFADKICAGNNFVACLQGGKIVVYGAKFGPPPPKTTFVDVFCGPLFVMGLSDKGAIHAWGVRGQATPELPAGLGPIKFAAANNNTIVVIKSDDRLASAGPLAAPAGQFKFVSGIGSYFVGIKNDDSVVSWGQKPYALPDDLTGKYVCGGAAYGLCIDMDNNVMSFGRGEHGETVVPVEYGLPKVFESVEEMEPPAVILSLEPATKPVSIAHIPTISDIIEGGEATIADFLMLHQGDACVFEHAGSQSGITKSFLKSEIESGDGIFYKCLARKNFNPPAERGTFEPDNVVNHPYVKLALNGTFYVPAEDALKLFGAHQFWRLVPTTTVLEFTCGYAAAVAGGPVVGSDHCQDGTQKRIHRLQPYRMSGVAAAVVGAAGVGAEAGEEEGAEEKGGDGSAGEGPTITLSHVNGTVTKMDVSKSLVVKTIMASYATLLGRPGKKFRFFYDGQELTGHMRVTPGSTISVMDRAGGGRLTRKARR